MDQSGPWFCTLLADGAVVTDGTQGAPALCVGPFERWDVCTAFARKWVPASAERGRELYTTHCVDLPLLCLWDNGPVHALHVIFCQATTATLVGTIRDTHNKLKGGSGAAVERTKKSKKKV